MLFIGRVKIKKKESGSTALFSAHHPRFAVAWIEYVMPFKSVMMMTWMMRMLVGHSMRMTLMSKEVCMLIGFVRRIVTCYIAQDVRSRSIP
ncbi:MAG: hypothetical protein M3297_13820 [Thermoproteota archaeon]|nr:hypothetical protein [Thermoproteota archaeon]